jgi:hypothetical protein
VGRSASLSERRPEAQELLDHVPPAGEKAGTEEGVPEIVVALILLEKHQ